MRQTLKKYDITQCALYKGRNKGRIEKILLLEHGGLKQIDSIIRYHSFQIDKKNSTEKRTITAPDRILKEVQRRILFLLQKVIRPEWLMSGEKGKCYIDNGKAHLSSKYALMIDIKKFYDNCTREAVYQFFIKKLCTEPDIAKILTDIVTFNAGIPTGCPTSQIISFYAYSDMFDEISNVAKEYGCVFTLYVDDMTFSSTTPFHQKELRRKIDVILRKYGHKPKYSKMRFYTAKECKPITGTIVTPNNELAAPNRLQKSVYNTFQEVKPALEKPVCSNEEAQKIATLKGQIQAVRNIEGNRFPEIMRLANSIKTPEKTGQTSAKHRKRNRKIRIMNTHSAKNNTALTN